MTADIRAAAERECLMCGSTYTPTDENQKFCQHMCKRQNYQVRRFGLECAVKWREWQERKLVRHRPAQTRLTPTREQIAEVLAQGYQAKYQPEYRLPVNHHDLRAADAVLELLQELAEGGSNAQTE